jgi:hypothetical protein
MSEHDEFFVVWNPSRGAPSKKHPSRILAHTEAYRLAKKHPEESFFVLRAEMCVYGNINVVQLPLRELEAPDALS